MTNQDGLVFAIYAKRAYADAPTIGNPSSASRMHVYGDVHAFRGTDDLRAVLADVKCSMTEVWGLGKIHAGFYAALAAILPACLALPRPKAITGHSLGAAMAIIYSAVLAQMGIIVPVYAFEPPRLCGDTVMAQLLKDRKVPFFATRNGNDVVTQVPSGLMLPGPISQIGQASFPMANITDHSIDRVIDALKV
jgi:hypothetical protein